MKIYLATWLLEPQQGIALSAVKNKTRLISYFHTIKKSDELEYYVKNGICPEKNK